MVRKRLSLVERVRDPNGERVAEGCERAGLAQVRLRVADPDLDRREGEVRTNAPPDLGVLVDRAGVVEEADVALEAVPAVVGVRHAAAREHAREDLRPRRMQAG